MNSVIDNVWASHVNKIPVEIHSRERFNPEREIVTIMNPLITTVLDKLYW